VKNSFEKGNFSAEYLRTYQRGFVKLLGFDFKVMLRIRRFLDSLSDERLDEALSICNRLELDKALWGVDEIDFQGRTLLKVVTKPAAFAMLAYFVLVYMTTNA